MINTEWFDFKSDPDHRKNEVVVVNGLNLNRNMVSVGLAWVYPQYCKRPE